MTDNFSYAIVTDSAADISEFIMNEPGIYIVDNSIVIDKKELIEGKDITREEFIRRLNCGELATTSQASPEAMLTTYSKALESYPRALGIHVGGKLSGVLNNANVAKRRIGEQVIIFDSDSVSIGLTYLIELASECRRRGMGINDTIKILEKAKKKIYIQVIIGSLKYIRHGGRLNTGQFFLLNMLRVKPIITVKKGLIEKNGAALGFKSGIAKLSKRAKQTMGGDSEIYLAIGSVEADTEMQDLAAFIQSNLNIQTTRTTGLSAVIIAHVGPKAVGYAVAPAIQTYFG